MTREDKIKLVINKGFIYNETTGKIHNRFGKEITAKLNGYIKMVVYLDGKQYIIRGHQFAYYIKHNKIVDCIDHINGIKNDNRIDNLRDVTHQQNQQNQKNPKGYYFNKKLNKFQSYIILNKKHIHLGVFDTEQEANQAYLDAKKIYHKI